MRSLLGALIFTFVLLAGSALEILITDFSSSVWVWVYAALAAIFAFTVMRLSR